MPPLGKRAREWGAGFILVTIHPDMTTTFQIYNTLTGAKETFQPIEPGKVRLYVCGPTVYDDAHLGHARCYITWDVLFRFLQFLGYDVTYVRNVTDVDDKIINRARQEQKTPAEIAAIYYQRFSEDMARLNILTPTQEPRATDYIATMHQGIQAMIDNGFAYPVADGTVYFRTDKKLDYAKLSKKPLKDLRAGERVDVDPNKESPLDFALWKGIAKDDPDGWQSPWGWGRPGWHMECSAMNYDCLGEQIDIHAGGADLIFPHHENEIAQSECWTGKDPFARYWMHNGFVNVSGEKMSKSLGNFSTVRTLLNRYDANTIRYFLLTNHYSMPVDFNDEALQGAENWIKKLYRQRKHISTKCSAMSPATFTNTEEGNAFVTAMQDNLNTPKALASLNLALSAPDPDWALIQTMLMLLGFDVSLATQTHSVELPVEALRTIYNELTGNWLEADCSPEAWLDAIIELRKTAKATKNWQQADAIRKHLSDIGIQLMDGKDGSTTYEISVPHANA